MSSATVHRHHIDFYRYRSTCIACLPQVTPTACRRNCRRTPLAAVVPQRRSSPLQNDRQYGDVSSRRQADAHCLKSNVTELRLHKVSWRIQPRNWRQASHRRRQEPPRHIGEPDLGIYTSGVLRLIDTLVGSPKGHYVNPPTRGFSRMPKERRARSLTVSAVSLTFRVDTALRQRMPYTENAQDGRTRSRRAQTTHSETVSGHPRHPQPLPHHPNAVGNDALPEPQYASRSGLINIKRDDALLHLLTGHYRLDGCRCGMS